MSMKRSDMQKLSKMTDVQQMKSLAVDMLQGSNTAPRKKAKLVNDIKGYNRADRVLKLMWNAFMSGEGMGAIGSKYSRSMAEEVGLVDYFERMNRSIVVNVIEATSLLEEVDGDAIKGIADKIKSMGYEVSVKKSSLGGSASHFIKVFGSKDTWKNGIAMNSPFHVTIMIDDNTIEMSQVSYQVRNAKVKMRKTKFKDVRDLEKKIIEYFEKNKSKIEGILSEEVAVIEEKDTHKTKDGRTAKKGLYYYINQKRKRGEKPNPPGHEDRPSEQAFKDAAKTANESFDIEEGIIGDMGKAMKDAWKSSGGKSKQDIIDTVNKLDTKALRTIAAYASPKTARRILPKNQYIMWDAATKRLKSMNEEVKLNEARRKRKLAPMEKKPTGFRTYDKVKAGDRTGYIRKVDQEDRTAIVDFGKGEKVEMDFEELTLVKTASGTKVNESVNQLDELILSSAAAAAARKKKKLAAMRKAQQAKQKNESVEQIDEISRELVKKYQRKASLDFVKHDKPNVEMQKRAQKRRRGLDIARKKLRPTSESVTEAKSSTGYDIYHKTFSSAVQHALSQVEKKGYTVDGDEWDRKVALGPKKPSAGKTNSYTIDLMKNGKETPRKLQMQVYYDEGRYELNMYIS